MNNSKSKIDSDIVTTSNYIDDNVVKRKIYKINNIGTGKLYIFDETNSNLNLNSNEIRINSYIENDDFIKGNLVCIDR